MPKVRKGAYTFSAVKRAFQIWSSVIVICFSIFLYWLIFVKAELYNSTAFIGNKSSDDPYPESEYNFHVSKGFLNRDGISKPTYFVNNRFPGPIIRCRKGDTIKVNVHNELPGIESTSIHWHGIRQRGSNVMDGAPGITQCGIPRGLNFTYVFHADKSGTYFWHSHSHSQRSDGLFGALIVQDELEDFTELHGKYDDEIVVFLSDHYHDGFQEKLEWYLSPRSQGMEPVPDVGFINGFGVFNCSTLLNDKHDCDQSTGKLAEFRLEKNKRYRMRIINAATIANFQFSIDEHNLDVIEADSTELVGTTVHHLPIAAGQRYSVIINTNSTVRNAFYMRAKMNEECFNYINPYLDPEVKAIVMYVDRNIKTRGKDLVRRKLLGSQIVPESRTWSELLDQNMCLDLDERSLVPLLPSSAPTPDVRVILYFNIDRLEKRNRAPYGFVNRTSFLPAIGAPNLHVATGNANISETVRVPTIHGMKNTNIWGGDQMVVKIPFNSIVEVVLNNVDESPHPFHLHGHDFWVVRNFEPLVSNGQWSPEMESEYSTVNPIRRDTVTVPRFGHTVIRWKADNKGIWPLHCHMEWHMATGMLMQFAVGMENFEERIPDVMKEHCEVERKLGKKLVKPLPGSEYGT